MPNLLHVAMWRHYLPALGGRAGRLQGTGPALHSRLPKTSPRSPPTDFDGSSLPAVRPAAAAAAVDLHTIVKIIVEQQNDRTNLFNTLSKELNDFRLECEKESRDDIYKEVTRTILFRKFGARLPAATASGGSASNDEILRKFILKYETPKEKGGANDQLKEALNHLKTKMKYRRGRFWSRNRNVTMKDLRNEMRRFRSDLRLDLALAVHMLSDMQTPESSAKDDAKDDEKSGWKSAIAAILRVGWEILRSGPFLAARNGTSQLLYVGKLQDPWGDDENDAKYSFIDDAKLATICISSSSTSYLSKEADSLSTAVRATPGMAFAGDAVLIRGSGRTDFQATLISSLSQMMHVSTVAQKSLVPTMGEMVEMWKKNKQNPFGIIYSWFHAKVGSKLEVMPGAEFRMGFDEAMKYGGKVILGDRPVQITREKLALWHKTKLITSLVFQAISLPDPETLSRMLKEMDDVDMLTLIIQEMSKQYPTLMETLVHERDKYMSSTLLRVASEHNSVVAVVGKGHLAGIKKPWKEPIEIMDLLEMPVPKPGVPVKKILKFLGVAVAGVAITQARNDTSLDSI